MKKIYYVLSFVAISLVFMGCPYSSDVPLDKQPAVKADANLIGVWGPESTSDSTTYTVSKTDDFTYLIKKESTSYNETTITKYKAYLSDIGGNRFINIWADDGNTPKYYLYKLEWADDNKKLIMHEVTDNITETFTTSDDLKKFVDTYQKLSFFFNKDKVTYVKK